MSSPLSDAELELIEQRLHGALSVAPPPWVEGLETRYGLGGESFVRFEGDPGVDNEMYLDVRLGSERLTSPDERLDLIIDFIGHAAEDVTRLLTEVRRLRSNQT